MGRYCYNRQEKEKEKEKEKSQDLVNIKHINIFSDFEQ